MGTNNEIYEQINDQNATKCKNQTILDRFRRDEINLIVASDVLEEGVDLQMCNLVISYDLPQTFRSYVQSKGRARMKESTYILMTPRNNFSKMVNVVSEYRATEVVLKEVSKQTTNSSSTNKAIQYNLILFSVSLEKL